MTTKKAFSSSKKHHESQAVIFSAVWAIVAFILGIIIYGDRYVPLFGHDSVGLTSALLAMVASGSVSFWGLYTQHPRVAELRALKSSKVGLIRRWIKVFSLTFVIAMLGFLLTSIVFFVIQQAFQGVTFDTYASAVASATAAGIASYTSYLVAVTMTPMILSSLLALFLVSGVLSSAISNSDPNWWEYHFSSLGSGGSLSAGAFNITLIIAGLVIWVLAGILAGDLYELQRQQKTIYPRRIKVFHWSLVAIGVALAMVGAFVYDVHVTIHNSSAGSMAIVFLALVTALPYIVPNLTKAFYGFSYSMLAALAVAVYLFYGTGYFNLTAFELVAAAIIFTWLVVLVRQIAAQLNDTGDDEIHLTA
ncbi:hypothetical protein EOL96_05785 [Candidatus Saccharibacteria bacterium]|nr:hypothetical protein [Candidatus Saccharibacteria bacterium]